MKTSAALSTLFAVLAFTCFSVTSIAQDKWLSMKNGRLNQLYYTSDPDQLNSFKPTGKLDYELIKGNLSVKVFHGVYYSDQENPSTANDLPASMEITIDSKKVFSARGYKFGEAAIDTGGYGATIAWTHWTGVMGTNQITLFKARYKHDDLSIESVSHHSTKDWRSLTEQ
ncbi:hypothetical protein EOPP23_07220 [Endozoicomonas sp. OPT23]|uniref:hypothetical protein n=1 Tax=Endozoicomonas sp. OPT23 TaxID=2072845 RepID=UPI00129AD82E|nr:hypothetical protein [Endozoicomonas sp. OPT23]MRI32772.1 hypothetical protein [Endozoicomonas sp. OPT23]